jgi:UDP-N-acetylglucosamine--N-acetylmuramyl-(pentapeptide) pyrophosphoryl-undecaprenol N-acetylglucosamine transferase
MFPGEDELKIAIVSGGTGGHIYPGIAIAEEIMVRNPRAEILFLGSKEGLEKEIIPRAGFKIKFIRARAFLRKISYQALSAPFVAIFGFFQAWVILKKFSPSALISTGGYASLPAVFAARCLSIPIYLHEQNVLPGFTNRLFSRWARRVFLSFEESSCYLKGVVTGNPVRGEIMHAEREKARRDLGFSPDAFVVLVMGGSQGARRINQTILQSLSQLKGVEILHILGERDTRVFAGQLSAIHYAFYHPVEYLYNMGKALAAADLVVSRAGATAIAEFLVRGIPMVLIPFPYSAEGHQDLNAQVLVERGAAIKINDCAFTPEKFVSLVSGQTLDLLQMKNNSLKLARPGAAGEIANALV